MSGGLRARAYDVAAVTQLDPMERLGARLGRKAMLKREDLQHVHSFKIRGAYNHIVDLEDEPHAAGVICASVGNHGQGVPMSAALGFWRQWSCP